MTWDPSLVDFSAPSDGRIIQAVGGASGNLSLLNGQKISFPWKRQQETLGADIATIHVLESSDGGVDYEAMLLRGPSLTASGTQAAITLVGWEDNTSSVVIAQEEGGANRIVLTNGGVYSDSPFIAQSGATINGGTLDVNGGMSVDGGVLDVNGGMTVDGGTLDVNAGMSVDGGVTDINGGIDATGGSAIITSSGAKVAITSPDNYDVEIQGGDDIQLFADIDVRVYATTGNITIWPFAGDTTILGNNLVLTAASTYDITLTASGTGGDIILSVGGNSVNVSTMVGARTAHSPAVQQPGSISKTDTVSSYRKVGREVTFSFVYAMTAGGTGGNNVKVALPFTAANANNQPVGPGWIYDGSSNNMGVWALDTTTTISLVIPGGYYTTALASGHSVVGTIVYQAAS